VVSLAQMGIVAPARAESFPARLPTRHSAVGAMARARTQSTRSIAKPDVWPARFGLHGEPPAIRQRRFHARLHIGGRAARLVAHDPRPSPEILQGRRGLQELRDAFQRFEARIGPLADRFVDGALTSNEFIGAERPRALGKGAARRTGSAANSL
jgi:hypothetical protein